MFDATFFLRVLAVSLYPLGLAAVWLTASAIALHRRPAAGTSASAIGFGVLGMLDLIRGAIYLWFGVQASFDLRIADEWVHQVSSISQEYGGLIAVPSAVLVVIGVSRTWNDPARMEHRSSQNASETF